MEFIMKSFIIAAVAVVLSAGVASAAVGNQACVATGNGNVVCGTIVIQY
jgi:opacity protein-like surface antigen